LTMRHNRDWRKLNRTASHRRAMLRNMVTSLFAVERIHTTTAKAREARRVAERMITFARRGDLSARRHVAKTVNDPAVLQKLFTEIAPRYVERPGGYTRILKLGIRRGDAAQRVILELVGADEEGRKKNKKARKKRQKVEVPEKRPAAKGKAKRKEEAAGGTAEPGADAGKAVEEAAPGEAPEGTAGEGGDSERSVDEAPAEAEAAEEETAGKRKADTGDKKEPEKGGTR
jgi:large subunit ribosomal protein L17